MGTASQQLPQRLLATHTWEAAAAASSKFLAQLSCSRLFRKSLGSVKVQLLCHGAGCSKNCPGSSLKVTFRESVRGW
jgi:hypothetical protein